MKKENIHEELEGLSPLLRQLHEKGSGMTTPPDYFNDLNKRVMERIAREEGPPKIVLKPFWSVYRTIAAAAASVVLVVASWWWMQPQVPNQVVTVPVPEWSATDTLTQEDAERYIEENILDFDMEMLAGAFEESNDAASPSNENPQKLKKAVTHSEELDEVLDELTEEELEDLL